MIAWENTEPWQARAGCLDEDPELFFPHDERRGSEAQVAEATTVCHTKCPVQMECFDYAVRTRQRYGVWGGVDLNNQRPTRKALLRAQEEVLQER